MKTIVIVIALTLSTILLPGCVSFVKSDVAVFHQLEENPIPTTYTFFPLEGQECSLEYKTYQDLIRQQLRRCQYIEVMPEETPEVVVAFSYGINSGKEKLGSIPLFGQTGVSPSPTYGIVGSSTVSRT